MESRRACGVVVASGLRCILSRPCSLVDTAVTRDRQVRSADAERPTLGGPEALDVGVLADVDPAQETKKVEKCTTFV